MSDLGDRLLMLVVAATAIGGVYYWIWSYADSTLVGTTRLAALGATGALYVLTLVGIWLGFAHLDRT